MIIDNIINNIIDNDDNNDRIIDSTEVVVVLDTSLIHYILEYIDSDLNLLIHREGSDDVDRSKALSIGLIMRSGLEDYFQDVILSERFKDKYCDECAKRGQLDSLKWARERGCPWGKVAYENGGTCMEAARAGHLDILKWLRKNGCPWNVRTCSAAAEAGRIDILLWARANGCGNRAKRNSYICSSAARGGHLHLLQWLRENGY